MGPKSAMTDMPGVDRGQRITVTISILEVSQNVQKHHNPIDGHSKEENPEPHSRLNVYRKTNLHPLLLEAEKKRRQTEQEGEGHAGGRVCSVSCPSRSAGPDMYTDSLSSRRFPLGCFPSRTTYAFFYEIASF